MSIPNQLSLSREHCRTLLSLVEKVVGLYPFRSVSGELFRSDQPVGDYGLASLEFFQRDRQFNPKGIIAIDLLRWES